MKKRFLRITLFLLLLMINKICLASEIEVLTSEIEVLASELEVLYGIGVPVNVDFKVSPYKRVYSHGEEVNVDVRIYFDRELIGEEIGRDYLVIGNFTTGCEVRGLKKNRTSEAPWTTLEVSESSFNNNYIYLRNQSDEVHGNFKIKITDKIARIELYAMSYMLGVRDILGESRSSQMTVNGETISYIRTRRCEYQNIPETKLQHQNESSKEN